MSSRRQQIVDKVLERFAAIKTANGYQTDIGNTLSEWRTEAFAEEELPGINLRDEMETVSSESKNSGSVLRTLNITADLVLKESAVTASAARRAQADVEKAIAVDPRWGGLATRTLMKESRLMADERGLWLGGARVAFAIEYYTKPFEA